MLAGEEESKAKLFQIHNITMNHGSFTLSY